MNVCTKSHGSCWDILLWITMNDSVSFSQNVKSTLLKVDDHFKFCFLWLLTVRYTWGALKIMDSVENHCSTLTRGILSLCLVHYVHSHPALSCSYSTAQNIQQLSGQIWRCTTRFRYSGFERLNPAKPFYICQGHSVPSRLKNNTDEYPW